ncbi:MAG TPA: hypothetical protein VEG60_17195 [Candidatus Binatia bacterium]|nr:hypothetical protein [Candidatus Binatia bacterium]
MDGVTTRDGTTQIRRARLNVSFEVIGEMVLLAVVGGFFVYLFIESLEWPLGSALMPWIALGIGAPFWVYRFLVLILRVREAPAGQIMDIGFRTGGDPKGERARFFRIALFILGLYLGIWLFGFHVALPLGILFYVRVYGQLSWLGSLFVAFMFLALLVGVYDRLLNAVWHEPLAWQWFGSIL